MKEHPVDFERATDYAVATWHNMLLMLWTGKITVASLDVTERAGKMLDTKFPKGQVAVSISAGKVPVPDDAVRTHAARLMRERAPFVLVTVTVIEGEGFLLSAGRMVITALNLLSGARTKPIVAKTVEEAAEAVHTHVTPKATLSEVTHALRTFRERG